MITGQIFAPEKSAFPPSLAVKLYFTCPCPCPHALCNAHHVRELETAWEQDHPVWAQRMKGLLEEINAATQAAGGQLTPEMAQAYRITYRQLLADAQRECPPPDTPAPTGKRGRQKRSKARNLLERVVNYEEEVLRFIENLRVPFTKVPAREARRKRAMAGNLRRYTGKESLINK